MPEITAVQKQRTHTVSKHLSSVRAEHTHTNAPGGDLLQALEECVHLPQLDVVELRVCVDVGVGDADECALGVCVEDGRLHRFQHGDQRDVVLRLDRTAGQATAVVRKVVETGPATMPYRMRI